MCDEEDLRCLEGLRELVPKFSPRVDGEDPRDGDSDGAVRIDVLQRVEWQCYFYYLLLTCPRQSESGHLG